MRVLLYAGRRLIWTVPTFLGALVVIFLLTQAVPGDAVMARVGQSVDPQTIDAVRKSMGLDKPAWAQFLIYLQHLSQGNLGHSWKTGNDVTSDLVQRLPATIELALWSLALAIPIGLGLGVLAAGRRGGWIDRAIQTYCVLGLGVPVFWLSLMLVYVFFFRLGWAPSPMGRLDILDTSPPHVTGMVTIDSLLARNLGTFRSALLHLLLPVVSVVFITVAPIARMTYSCMTGQLQANYVRAAVASGVSAKLIFGKYALKNAMIPVVTLVGAIVKFLIGGVLVVEIVFAWPGIGRYAIESMLVADTAPLQAVVLIVTGATLLINILVDVSYYWLDPRIEVT